MSNHIKSIGFFPGLSWLDLNKMCPDQIDQKIMAKTKDSDGEDR